MGIDASLASIIGPKPCFLMNGQSMSLTSSKLNWSEGEQFTGILQIKSSVDIPPIYCDILIDCCEFAKWRVSTGGSDAQTRTKFDACISLSKRFTILQSSNGFEAGKYDFPVKFQIPDGLPGTFIHKNRHLFLNAALTYNLYVEVFD